MFNLLCQLVYYFGEFKRIIYTNI